MKVMISQPMRGKTNEQIRQERDEVVKLLEKEGHQVVDTIIDDFIEGEGNNYAIRCLSKSIEFIADADALVLMSGWENSRGCIIENRIALEYGKFVRYL